MNKKHFAVTAILSLMATTALATNDQPKSQPTSTSSSTGVGVGLAGAASKSVSHSQSTNTNRNQQQQGQMQSNRLNNRNTSSSDNANNAQQSLDSNIHNGVSTGSNVTITHEREVATAYAPTPVPTASCLGSAGVGYQGAFGFSFGGSIRYEDCMRQEKVKTIMHVLGDRATAEEVMCADAEYREARERSGRPCAAAPIGSVAASENGFDHNDPHIRARLGLAPQ